MRKELNIGNGRERLGDGSRGDVSTWVGVPMEYYICLCINRERESNDEVRWGDILSVLGYGSRGRAC